MIINHIISIGITGIVLIILSLSILLLIYSYDSFYYEWCDVMLSPAFFHDLSRQVSSFLFDRVYGPPARVSGGGAGLECTTAAVNYSQDAAHNRH